MPKIALITSDPDFFELAGRICKELELQREIDLYLTHLAEAARLAEKLQHEGVDVIIARGGLAMLILAAGINIPLVEVVITGQDLARIFLEARETTGLERPKAAFIAFDNMVADVEIIARITNVDLTIYRLQTNEDIPVMVDAVADREHDVILGGTKTVALARKRGLRATLLQSGPLSTKNAILEAKKIARGRQIEKEESGKFKALIDFSLEGIISVDRDKRIQIINPAAQRLLNCSTRDLQGQPVSALLDPPEIDRCIKAGNEIRGHVMQLDNAWLSLNLGPIIVNQTPIGAFITFQEISRIQEAEATIRNEVLARKFQAKYTLEDILGRSPQIVEAKRIAAEIARTDATTLIIGESGTGKELFAQSIHNLSDRRQGPFVAINCAALPPNLLESELFGYVEGAFTGATKKGKPGLFEMAHRGTLFLDEISEMDKYGQSRLLRVLQEKQIMRLGGEKNVPVDVRIIAACNRNLPQLIEAGQFRQDLYYRLKVLVLNLPQLQQRSGDVEFLAREFIKRHGQQYKRRIELNADAFTALARHPWPGNIRELMHFIERLTVTAGSRDVDAEIISRLLENREYENLGAPLAIQASRMQTTEDAAIVSALECNRYNIKKTASDLGMSRPTLYRKLRQYQIQIKKTF